MSSSKKIVAGLLGVAMVLTLVVGVAVSTASAQTSTYTRNLTIGSRGADVTALQTTLVAGGYLKVAPTGYFGSLTKAALAAWQAAVGISPASGYFGPITRAYLATAPVTNPGTPNPGTGTGTVMDGTDGSITVSSSPFVSSGQQIKKGETKNVVAVRLQATSGKVSVNRFDVHFSVRPWLYFSQVQLKDANGTVLATKSLTSAADATEITVGSDYLVRFENVNYTVTPGTDGTLVVAAGVLSSTDKLTQNTSVTVSIPSGAIRTLNGKGYTDSSQPSTTISSSATLLASGSVGNVLTRISPNSPSTRIQQTSTSQVTSNVVLGVFGLKSENNNSTINSLNFNINNSTSAATSSIFSNVRLVVGGTTYGANSIVAGGTTFTNLNIALPQDQWVDLTLQADVAQNTTSVSASSTLVAAGINGVDSNYNTVTISSASNVSSSDVSFNTAAIALTSSSASYTLSGGTNGSKSANVVFTFTLSNTGNQDVYISKVPGVALGTSTTGSVGSPVAASSTLTYVTANPSEGNLSADTGTAPTSGVFVIPTGSSRTFTYSGTVDNTNGSNGLRVFKITQINFGTTTSNTTAANINFGLSNLVVTPSLVGQ